MTVDDHPGVRRRMTLATRTPALVSTLGHMLRRRRISSAPLLDGRSVPACRTCHRPQERIGVWTPSGDRHRAALKQWNTCRACHLPVQTAAVEHLHALIARSLPTPRWPAADTGAATGRRARPADRAWADIDAANDSALSEFQCTRCFVIHPAAYAADAAAKICQDCV